MKKQGETSGSAASTQQNYGKKSIGDYGSYMNEMLYGGKDDFETQ